MKRYLLRTVVLLVTFALGVGAALTGRQLQTAVALGARSADQKPFVLVVRKRGGGSVQEKSCR